MGGSCGDEVFDRCALSTESISLSDPTSLSHSSNRIRLVGLGDCASFSNRRLSPIIRVRVWVADGTVRVSHMYWLNTTVSFKRC